MHLPARFAAVISTFTPVFLQQRTWRRAELLLIGAILAPGKRTVTSLLRITGLTQPGTTVHQLPSRPQPGRLGPPRGGLPAARPADHRLCPARPCRARNR